MAFVFRSDKYSPFDIKNIYPDSNKPYSITNQQSHLNGTSYTTLLLVNISNSPNKIVKGLPSLLKKHNNNQLQHFQSQKQNKIFPEDKNQKLKVNLQKLKKINQNFFFSSNVVQQANNTPFKPLNKSLTCSQFNSSSRQQLSMFEQDKPFMTNYLTSNYVVNKNILNTSNQKNDNFRKTVTDSYSGDDNSDKLLINCSKQNIIQIKRKSSPPRNTDKSSTNSITKKLKQIKIKSKENTSQDKSQIVMKTPLQGLNNPLKKCQTQKKLKKIHKGNLQSSFYKLSDSQHSEEQYQNQTETPGPGAYDSTINIKQKKSFRSRKQKFAKIFVSPLQRFKTQEVKYQEITYVNEGKPQKIYKNQVFLSKSPKLVPEKQKSNSPQPGSYNPRSSLEHDIVRNLLRNANVASFNSTLPRFKQQKQIPTPGPGQYNIDRLQKARLQEIRNQMSSCYKSQVKRCLDYCKTDFMRQQNDAKLQMITEQVSEDSVLHRRVQHFDSSQFFSPPPFLSGVQRFTEQTGQTNQVITNSSAQPKILTKIQKVEKNVQPFNSSQKRKLTQNIGEGVGVGCYVMDKDKWNKKSYNIFFH